MEGGATAVAASSAIRPINKSVVHKISAGQVILDLSSAVKELVENSLDAGATSIEISLKEYGEEWFQVIDNGCGISPNDFKALALKHHTSKLVEFPDIQSLTTFGFRGEALSSLCALGDLTVETRTKNESVATHLTFDHCGVLVAEKKTARQIGTTMMVKKLFSNLPVRSKEFHRNIRKEYGKLISLLNAYALIAKGVRLICSNTTGRNSKSVVLKTQGSGCLKDNIINVFGMSTFTCLDPVSLFISDSCKVEGFLSKPGYGSGRNLGDRQFFFVNGRPVEMPKVTKLVNELYKGANSRQYPIAIIDFTVPTRVCDVNVTPDKRKIFLSDEVSILHSLRDALGKIYSPGHASYSINRIEELDHENGRSQLSLKQPSLNAGDSHEETCGSDEHVNGGTSTKNKDINRCPPDLKVSGNDDENSVGKDFALKGHGTKKADRLSCSRQLINDLATAKTDQHASVGFQTIEKSNTENIDSPGRPSIVQSSLAKFVTINKRKHESITTTLSEVPVLRNEPVLQSKKNNPQVKIGSSVPPLANFQKVDDCDETAKYCPQPSKCARVDEGFNEADITIPSSVNARAGECGENLGTPEKAPSVADSLLNVSSSKKLGASEHLVDAKIPTESSALASETSSSGLKTGPSTLHFSFEELKIKRQQRLSRLQSCNLKHGRTMIKGCYNDATLDLSQVTEEGKAKALAAATKELERLFKKEDFGQMKVIGQFNLGFIIAKLDQDLFIVDQHAADEKYNYERLSQSTIFNQQPLLRPLQLELSPEEEIVVSMHMDTFRKNGFILQEDDHAPPGGRFYLKAVPFSKNITFGVADVKELVSILSDSQGECSMMGTYKMDTPNSVCPPRVRAMLASRACRSSVMIGDPLDKNEMRKIVNHLAGLKSPWNCPHGRPTMRHLVDLTTLRRRLDDEDDNIVSIL